MTSEGRYELHVGGDPAGLSTIRVFARAVGRSVDADAERIDDLQLIVSEICSELLESGGRELHLTVRPDEDALDVSVDAAGATGAADAEDNAFRRELLRSVSPQISWSEAGARFRLALPVTAEPAHER